MLLVIAIVLLLLFAGLGFVVHVWWLGLLLAVIIGVARMPTGNRAYVQVTAGEPPGHRSTRPAFRPALTPPKAPA